MKLWLCVLSALLLAGCTAGTDVPGSVTPTAVPTPAATETGETAEVAATPSFPSSRSTGADFASGTNTFRSMSWVPRGAA